MSTDLPSHDGSAPRSRRTLFALIPLLVFLALALVFLFQLSSGRDSSIIPSALIGKPAPQTLLEPLAGLQSNGAQVPGLDPAQFKGEVTLLNVFASWCPPCREEHPVLMELAKDGRFRMAGLNYKDSQANALDFLNGTGNPFDVVGVDAKGRAGIEWGVYGPPETFLIDRNGIIVYKHIGPFTGAIVNTDLMPAIEKALAAQ